jgi:adenosylcobinamide amidohydrolase
MRMTSLPFQLELKPRLLILRFKKAHRTLGWPINRPGFASTQAVIWLEVSDDELGAHIDPLAFVRARLAPHGLANAAAFMTAREITRYHVAQQRVGDAAVACLTTVGLTNGEWIGSRRSRREFAVGTINTLVHMSRPLSDGAFVESVSIATQARTAAIMETNRLREAPAITGTGTDCMLVAAPEGDAPETCVGLHTDLGEAIGRAVYDATYEGAATWSAELMADRKRRESR